MKKKTIIAIGILLTLIFLFSVPTRLKDGGTVKYQAVLYSVSDVHRLSMSEPDGYEDGIMIEVLGVQVFNNVEKQSETVRFHEQVFRKADLSEETLQWLKWYNGLTEEEQLSISYIPADLYKLCGYGDTQDAPAEAQ